MTIDRLCCFVTAVKHMNFTRAAAELHMAQTAMSRQIAMLESELDCRLFDRSNRTIQLTPAGKCFFDGISPLLKNYDKIVKETQMVGKRLAGELRIGIGQYEQSFVSELVKEFHQSYPMVEVMVTKYGYQELLEHLSTGEIDIAFALPVSMEYLADQAVDIQTLFSSEVCIAMNTDHPLAGAATFPKERCGQERLLTISEESGPCSLDNLLEKFQKTQVHFADVRRVNSLDAVLLMVKAGIGIAIIPEFLKNELPEGVITVPTNDWHATVNQFVAIARKGAKEPQVETFIRGLFTSTTLWEKMEQLKGQ